MYLSRNLATRFCSCHAGLSLAQRIESYGIEVARLAALPMSVIERAREILAHHESAVTEELAPIGAPMQIRLFEPVSITNSPIASAILN